MPVEDLGLVDVAGERGLNGRARHALLVHGLPAHEGGVVCKRHRRRADVTATAQGVRGFGASLVGQAVAQLGVEAEARPDLDAAYAPQDQENLVGDRASNCSLPLPP